MKNLVPSFDEFLSEGKSFDIPEMDRDNKKYLEVMNKVKKGDTFTMTLDGVEFDAIKKSDLKKNKPAATVISFGHDYEGASGADSLTVIDPAKVIKSYMFDGEEDTVVIAEYPGNKEYYIALPKVY